MGVDKNKAIVEYILQCPVITNNPVFFNAIKAQDNSKGIVTLANDKVMSRPYIDGSILKRYSFTILDFRSISFNPLVTIAGYDNENVKDLLDVQGIIDWVTEQDEERNFPDFGEGYFVEKITTTTDNPNLNGVDNSTTPALAKYSITVQVEYMDNTKRIF